MENADRPATVTVQLMGRLRLWVDGTEVAIGRKPKLSPLLAYLAYPTVRDLKGRPLAQARRRETVRDDLIQTLWTSDEVDDSAQAHMRLRRLVSDLRDLLEPAEHLDGIHLLCTGQQIAFSRQVHTDVDDLIALQHLTLAAKASRERLRGLTAFLRLFQEGLLPGHDAEWIREERKWLAQTVAAVFGTDYDMASAQEAAQEAAASWEHMTLHAYDTALTDSCAIQVMRLCLYAQLPHVALKQYVRLLQILRSGSKPSQEARDLERQARAAAQDRARVQRRTRLIGRSAETADLRRMILDMPPLVTVTGPPGTGKTRLAEEVADSEAAEFGSRVVRVSLQALADPEQIIHAILKAMGVQRTPQEALEQLVAAFEPFPTLLLLDNFEHLLAAGGAEVVHSLIRRVPLLTCLVTSRERLRLEQEAEFPLAPLPVPHAQAEMEALPACPSVELFLARARSAYPAFRLTPENAASVRDLCRTLDGLPLALCMAGAWAKTLSPSDMLVRLQKGLDLLTRNRVHPQDWHRSLHATIEWSYSLLPEDAKTLFARLSVFRGGSSLEAVQELWGPHSLASLRLLLDHSLIEREPTEGDQTRYRMLETLRQFAQQKLEEGGAAEARQAHLRFFLALAEDTDRQIREGQQRQRLGLLDREMDNLRAALTWCWQYGEENESGTRLALGLHQFWELRGYLREGREQYARALAWPGLQALPALRSRLLVEQGTLEWRLGDLRQARSSLMEGLALTREQADAAQVARTLHMLGVVEKHLGNYGPAREHYEEALAIREGIGDEDGILRLLNNLAILHMDEGRHEESRQMHERCLPIRRRRNDLVGLGATLNNLGVALTQMDDYAAASPHFEESLRIRRELGDRPGTVSCLLNLATMACRDEDWAATRHLLRECLELAREIGDSGGISHALIIGFNVARAQGQDRLAARLCGAMEALREEIGSPLSPTFWNEYTDGRNEVETKLGTAAFAEEFAAGRLGGWKLAAASFLDPIP